WERRAQAANYYGQVANDSDAVEWLTVGTDQNGPGASASLGRLLQFFPSEFRRDRCWALQTLHVAESWNGRAFVEPLAALAEGAAIQLALVVYPASACSAFRQHFGIEGGLGSPGNAWAAEAFVETIAWPKKKASALVPAWFAKRKADAALLIVGDD